MSNRWTEKYRPTSLKEVLGNGKAISELREWAEAWEHGAPITGAAILYGPAGTGKTSAALALADELDWDYIEMNASDARTAGMIQAAKGIQFRSVRSTTIAQALREICKDEEIVCDPDALELIAERAGGDLRSAVNDLQAAAQGQTELKLVDVATAERDVKASIFKVLDVIFKGENATDALRASYDLDESPEDLIHWIDENLHLAYEGGDLCRGYESLSRADIFLGRVRVRQNYGLWRYAGFLMTGGVQAARERRRHGYIAFRPPGLWRRMGQSKKARNIRDSAARKIGGRVHLSARYVRAELMGFVVLLLKDKKLAPKVAAELDFNPEEIALLTGSTPTTKKVQSVFEEAQRIREAEAVEDIELAWGGTAQKSLERASSEVAGQRMTGKAVVKADPPESSSPAASSLAESPSASEETAMPNADAPKRGRGRPRKAKAEEEPKIEKKSEPLNAQTGKRQRSLFDF